jgi:hypothetical protein
MSGNAIIQSTSNSPLSTPSRPIARTADSLPRSLRISTLPKLEIPTPPPHLAGGYFRTHLTLLSNHSIPSHLTPSETPTPKQHPHTQYHHTRNHNTLTAPSHLIHPPTNQENPTIQITPLSSGAQSPQSPPNHHPITHPPLSPLPNPYHHSHQSDLSPNPLALASLPPPPPSASSRPTFPSPQPITPLPHPPDLPFPAACVKTNCSSSHLPNPRGKRKAKTSWPRRRPSDARFPAQLHLRFATDFRLRARGNAVL